MTASHASVHRKDLCFTNNCFLFFLLDFAILSSEAIITKKIFSFSHSLTIVQIFKSVYLCHSKQTQKLQFLHLPPSKKVLSFLLSFFSSQTWQQQQQFRLLLPLAKKATSRLLPNFAKEREGKGGRERKKPRRLG